MFECYIQELCLDLALKHTSYSHRQKHACVITYTNAIISSGINVNLKNDFIDLYNPLKCIHAESLAIMRAIPKHYNILHKSELWLCRNGKLSSYSKPFPMCLKIIKTFHIHTFHYTGEHVIWITESII